MSHLKTLLQSAFRAHELGRLDEAEALCAQVLSAAPQDIDANLLLGVIAAKTGRFDPAIEKLRFVADRQPNHPIAINWLSLALRQTGRTGDALSYAQRASQSRPPSPGAIALYGVLLLESGEFQAAADQFNQAISLQPSEASHRINLSNALGKLGRKTEAAAALKRSLKLGFNAEALLSLAEIELDLDRPEPALLHCDQLLERESSVPAMLARARALQDLDRREEAESQLREALALEPANGDIYSLLGLNLQATGLFQEADLAFRRSIQVQPEQGCAYYSLLSARKTTDSDRELLNQMEALLSNGSLSESARMHLLYALGKANEDLGNYESALQFFDQGNAVARHAHFDKAAFAGEIDQTIRTCDPTFFERNRLDVREDLHPIFIVGMPRSGTTLVEQILSCHPEICAAGELPFWAEASPRFAADRGDLDRERLKSAVDEYLEVLKKDAPGAVYVTDKNPGNFLYLDLILAALPNAKVIHVRRDPVDTAISIYTTPMRTPPPFACDRGNIVFAIQQYQRLMDHWRETLPAGQFREVDYESLVGHGEEASRGLVEFCGLPWDDSCLRPEENPRTVKTPSFWQVRQPIYKTSVARWKRYEPWLGPFRELLPNAPVPGAGASSSKSLRSLGRAFAIAMCLLLSAFGFGGSNPLHFWAVTGSVEDVRMYKELAKGFTAKTGIEVEVTPLAWGNFETKYFTGMAAGIPPDIGETNLGGPFNYGAVGGLVDLREEFPAEAKELEGRFSQNLPPMFTLGSHLYGLPSNLSTALVYYRTDVFKQLGLQPPHTWSELNAVIDKLEANGYRYYFGFPAYAQWALGLYTMPFGLAGVSRDAKGQPVVNWNEPNYQKGVLQALSLWYMHDAPGKDMGSRVLGLFRSTKPGEGVPLVIDQHNFYSGVHHDAPEIEGKWDVSPWPVADGGKPYNVMGGTSYVIFRKSKMKKEAMAWLQYLLSDEAQRQMTLDHLRRKTDPGMVIPSPASMWSPANDAFWQQPGLPNIGRLVEVLKQTVPTFGTVPTLQGQVETGRMEQNLLDQMGTFIQDGLNDLAQKKGISRSELIRDFGAGKYAEERRAFVGQVAQKLKSGYAAIQPQALTLVQTQEAHYQQRYGDIIGRLPDLEKQRNILDLVKAIAFTMLAVGLVAVFAIPRYRKHAVSYLFVAPPVVLAVVFVFVPAAVALYLSFNDYHPVLPLSTAQWVGTENYGTVAHSGDLGKALLNTLTYAVISLPLGIVIALLFAYLLNYKLVGQRFWRFLYFSPLVTSVVSIALIFTQLFLGGKQGWLNAILLKMGAVKDPVPFLQSEHTFLNCVIILAVWQGLAFTILVYLAGLQQISDQLYEAAELDGAGPTRRFWHVALPGIRPQLFFTTVLGLIGSFQVFELIYTLAGKSGDAGARFGPNDSALTMVPLIYHLGFETFEMGKSAAVAYVLFAIILVLTAGQVAIYKRVEAKS